jgi:hypothetical protein
VSDTSSFVAAGFRGRAARLASSDIATIAAQIGVPEVALSAVLAVETQGSGFDSAGRPQILFEPHVFFRNLGGDRLAKAMQLGLAYPHWGERPYPATSDGLYAELTLAVGIDETAALKACSWGIGQILGENFQAAGFDTPQAMVQACMDSEFAQLGMMAHFIVANGLAAALSAGDWAAFARGYNGPGYTSNRYDIKLASYVSAHSRMAGVQVASAAPPPAAQTADQLMAAELATLNAGTVA